MKGKGQIAIRFCLVSIALTLLSGTNAYLEAAQEEKKLPSTGLMGEANTDAATADARNGGRQPALQARKPRYELHNGDSFDLSFPFTPEFNQTITVQPDGYITMMGVGEVYAVGKTIPELTQVLQTAYAKILHKTVINIVMKDFQKPYFIASGELAHPGKYDLREDTTLTEAIAVAGGFTENSKHSQVFLFRRVSNNWVEVKKVDVKKMFQAGNLSEDLHLQAGDMVFVPQNRYSKIKRYIPSPGVGMTVNPY